MQAHFHLFTGNVLTQKELPLEAGKAFNPNDAGFWGHIISDLPELLRENRVTEQSFSILIQYEQGVNPRLYFI